MQQKIKVEEGQKHQKKIRQQAKETFTNLIRKKKKSRESLCEGASKNLKKSRSSGKVTISFLKGKFEPNTKSCKLHLQHK